MKEKKYNRKKVIQYAEKWAYSRNPKYYNYDNIGGDCTNVFAHSLVIVAKDGNDLDKIFIASHTFNSYNRKISSYKFEKIRFIHINKILMY